MFKWFRKVKKSKLIFGGLMTLLAVELAVLGIAVGISPSSDIGVGDNAITVGMGNKIIYVGMENVAYAAVTPDYTCDGVADDVQLKAAVDALPASGGKVEVLAGNYTLTATVSRGIDNVTIEGVGQGTYFAYNGSSAIFSAGSQDAWVFRDFSTDAGGVTVTNATSVILDNVWIGGVRYGDVRTATLVVAASDASDLSKAGADYFCDGTADDVQIQAAIDALPVNGGTIVCSEGTYYPSSVIDIDKAIDLQFNHSMFEVAAGVADALFTISHNDVRMLGHVNLDGNSIAARAISIGNYARIKIIGDFYITGFTTWGITTYQGYYITISGIFAANQLTPIFINGSAFVWLKDIYVQNTVADLNTSAIYIGSNIVGVATYCVNLDNIYINGNSAATNCTAILIGTNTTSPRASDFILNNIIVKDWPHDALDLLRVDGAEITNYHANSCTLGVSILSQKVTMSQFTIYGCSSAGVVIGDPDAVFDDTDYPTSNIILSDGVVQNSGAGSPGNLERDRAGVVVVGNVDLLPSQIEIDNVRSFNSGGNQTYGVSLYDYADNVTVKNCNLEGNVTGGLYLGTNLSNNIIRDNKGYIAAGEIRFVSKAITAGIQNTVTSIQNTFGGDVLIIEAYVTISTAASATNPTYDMGTDDDGAGAPSVGNNLFEAIPDTVGYYRALSNGLGGDASGVLIQPIIWQAVGNDWVNFIITDAAGADTAGTIYITVIGK